VVISITNVKQEAISSFMASIKVECLNKPAYVLKIKKQKTLTAIISPSDGDKYNDSNWLSEMLEITNLVIYIAKRQVNMSNNKTNQRGK